MSLIELRDVSKRFGRLVVLNGVSLNIEEGQSLVVIGASGSGKSVMLKHIVGLLEPDEGEVWFDGRRVDDLSEKDLIPVRRQFGFLFQMSALLQQNLCRLQPAVARGIEQRSQAAGSEIARSAIRRQAAPNNALSESETGH